MDNGCTQCGMPCKPGEYHPYAACLMFRACQNATTVRENLKAVAQQTPADTGNPVSPPAEAQPVGNLPERDPTRPNTEQGLYGKFRVSRIDGSDRPGGKHHGCDYFVLDATHDPLAKPALAAYATAAEATHPQLAADMRSRYGLAPPPSAPGGVEAYLVERLTGTGYGRARSIVDAAIYNPTESAFWIDREAQTRHRVTPLVSALAQQPAAIGEEIMVNAHDVYTLPLQPSGLSSGPRFVVHVPAPEQPAAPTLAKYQPCGCVICTCEDEYRCHGCGAKHCGNLADHPPYVVQQPAAVDGVCAAAAIRFALTDPEGMTFLRLWHEGEFDTLRREWPDAPSEVYVGADPLAAQQPEPKPEARGARIARRRDVRLWMRHNAGFYDTATELAEAADDVFRLPDGGLDNETHWVWDEAVDAINDAQREERS